MNPDLSSSHYTAAYQRIAGQLPGQSLPWLRTLRGDALNVFSERGFPTSREEEWRYTNVSAIAKKQFRPALTDGTDGLDEAWLQTQILDDAWTAVIVNGRFAPQWSNLAGLPGDVALMSLADALAAHPGRVCACLGQAVTNDEHSFVAFNNAWFSDGLFLDVPDKCVLSRPIQLLHVVTQADALTATRNLIRLGSAAQVRVVETYSGGDLAYLNAAVTEVFLGNNAGLALYKMQTESQKAYHFGGTYVKQARNSRFRHHNFAFGGLLARTDIHSDLDVASECDLNGLYLGAKRQHQDNHTRINHLQPHGISREKYKGVLDQRARGVFQGRVIVAEDAQKTDSVMNNSNLLLSDEAEADTKPQLEIYADDVKCAHGVTVGQLDAQSVFYLRSRCIDQETARNVLTFAFANEMIKPIDIPALHDMALKELLTRFPQHGVALEWL